MSEETNQSKPVTVSLDVVWQGSSAKHDARMSEISMSECYIDTNDHGRVLGDLVEFKAHLPSGPWVALKGELVVEDYPMGFGLRFVGLSEGDKRLLAQVVLAHGGDPGNWETPAPAGGLAPSLASHRRVLVADDDAMTLRLITAIIESDDYEVVAVSDGRQALQTLQRDQSFTAAIFDMTMPHLEGLDLILYMKADPRLQRIPVGMISAEQDPKIWNDSVAAGASVFLPKPFTPQQVRMMLRMLASKAA